MSLFSKMEEHHTLVYLSAEKGSAVKPRGGHCPEALLAALCRERHKANVAGAASANSHHCPQQSACLGTESPSPCRKECLVQVCTLPAEEVTHLWQPRQGHRACRTILEAVPG